MVSPLASTPYKLSHIRWVEKIRISIWWILLMEFCSKRGNTGSFAMLPVDFTEKIIRCSLTTVEMFSWCLLLRLQHAPLTALLDCTVINTTSWGLRWIRLDLLRILTGRYNRGTMSSLILFKAPWSSPGVRPKMWFMHLDINKGST